MRHLILALAAAVSLAACGDAVGDIQTPGSQPAVTAQQAQQAAEAALVQANQKLIVANEAYQTAAKAVIVAADAGLITPTMAVTLRALNKTAADALKRGNEATLAGDKLYEATMAMDNIAAVMSLLRKKP